MNAPPNILLLLSDEHSYRCLSFRDGDGAEPTDTPTLDGLAGSGCFFDAAYCQVPLCTPSRICLLTGRSPMGSGGWDNGAMLRPGIQTLPGALAQAGYATTLVGKMHLGGDRQFVGFQHRPYGDLTGHAGHQFDPIPTPDNPGDPNPFRGMRMRSRTVDAGVSTIPEALLQERCVAETTLAHLREHRANTPQQPWFCCASFSRPHFPLTAPQRFIDRYLDRVPPPKVGRTGDTADHPMTRGMAEGFNTKAIDEAEMMRARAAYFACVSQLDEIMGDMLAMLERSGLLENTIVVYTSDHGELAGEHGMWWKNSWHEAAARVPLIVQTPEHRSGKRPATTLQQPVSLADLMPTLCGFAGAQVPDDLDGIDLSSSIATGEEPQRGPVVFTNPMPRWGEGCEHVVLRDGRWKHVRFRGVGPDLLFDLEADPLEQRNLIETEPHQARRMDAFSREAWDFEAAQQQAADDDQLRKQHQFDAPKCHNAWHLPDGRVVDADAPMYHPRVIMDDPTQVISDMPKASR